MSDDDDSFSNLEDLNFALDCLSSEDRNRYAEEFDRRYRRKTEAFLEAKGAIRHEAEEIVEDTIAKCLTAPEGKEPKLARFNGTCSLQSWINTVALNEFLSYKRRRPPPPIEKSEIEGGGDDPTTPPVEPERAPLLDLLRSAIDAAFNDCSAEDFVLLELAYRDRIMGKELAVMFRCDDSKISRRLKQAGERIRKSTLGYIKTTDPYLKLVWEDFLELCRRTNPREFEDE